jgi:hypothetical protein
MKISSLLAVAAAALFATAAQAVVVTDCCDWASGWNFSSFGAGGGTASATVEASGGNPGARLNVTTVSPNPSTGVGTANYQIFSTTAPLEGLPFTLTLDVLSGAGSFGQGQAIDLLVEQNGSIYVLFVGVTGWPLNTFTTLNFPGTLTAASFTRVIGVGPATPIFNGTVSTTFGFAAGNSNSGTLTQYYDNFRLNIPTLNASIAPVPTLSQWSLIALVLLLAAVAMTLNLWRGKR